MLDIVKERMESRAKDNDGVQCAYSGGNDYDDMLRMANIQSNNEQTNMWYIDSGCLTTCMVIRTGSPS